MVRAEDVLDIGLLRRMHARGDFGGSYYVELQMAGEPTLHPGLADIVSLLRDEVGVMVGLSTHGLMIRKKPELADVLLGLDALTVSVDSVDADTYAKLRYPARLPQLFESLGVLFARAEARAEWGERNPFIELQLVDTPIAGDNAADVAALEAMMAERGWDRFASVRTTQDCFIEMQRWGTVPDRNERLCINPFGSVSVAHNGDVVSCCYVFEPDRAKANWYGNLNDESLADIWAGPRVAAMQSAHKAGCPPDQCESCYLWSPMRIHLNIASRLIRNRRGT
jgi:radical SAM protein with 4Fe4S-binding SPASM domain